MGDSLDSNTHIITKHYLFDNFLFSSQHLDCQHMILQYPCVLLLFCHEQAYLQWSYICWILSQFIQVTVFWSILIIIAIQDEPPPPTTTVVLLLRHTIIVCLVHTKVVLMILEDELYYWLIKLLCCTRALMTRWLVWCVITNNAAFPDSPYYKSREIQN